MDGLMIRLYNPEAAVLNIHSPSSTDSEEREIPFTKSPLDGCRGAATQKSRFRVRDATKKNTKTSAVKAIKR